MAMQYIVAALFALLVFPVHVYSYLFASTQYKFAGLTLRLYSFIPILRVNTIKNNPMRMDVNGKEMPLSPKNFRYRNLELARRLSILKIVQLGEYGTGSAASASAAVGQHILTDAVYEMLAYADPNITLKNYTILNEDTSHINYGIKLVNAVNLLSTMSIVILLIRGKFHEH